MDEQPQLVSMDVTDNVAWIRLDRPRAANAVNVEMLQQLYRALKRCESDPEVGAVVLCGEGKHFSAGGDIKEMASRGEDLPTFMVEITSWLNSCVLAMVQLPIPVIAAVHGTVAGGGGFGVMCAADLVVATESAKFFGPGTGLGMSPDAGTTVTLTARVGFPRAMELILMNTSLTAPEAKEAGLVNWVVADEELHERATEIAGKLAAGARRANGASKRLMWGAVEERLRAQLIEESAVISDLAQGPEVREGVGAGVDRRPADFAGVRAAQSHGGPVR
jgi:2-(1,2-epoxy-1,2-dihydrophenyl)acetyl-CoA isomerase